MPAATAHDAIIIEEFAAPLCSQLQTYIYIRFRSLHNFHYYYFHLGITANCEVLRRQFVCLSVRKHI